MRVGKCLVSRSFVSALAVGLLTFGASAFGQNPPGNTRYDIVPIGSTGPVDSLTGNDIVIPGGGVVVELELRVSNWAATGDGGMLSLQGTIDGSGYCSGPGDPLYPVGYPGAPVLACPQGNGCPVDGSTCDQGGFIVDKVCVVSANAGDFCSGGGDCPGGFCSGNPAYVMDGLNPIAAIAFPGLNFEYAGVSQAGSAVDTGGSEMFGTILVQVPAGAVGTYTINFSQDTERTFNGDGTAKSFAVQDLNAATITITSGSCCFNIGPGTTQCVNDVTAGTCDGMTAPTGFRAGEACPADGGEDCPNCLTDLDCNDSDACTVDTCTVATGVCVFTDNYNAAEDCCNPGDASLTTIDDFDGCTVDSCDAATGAVSNDAVAAAGLSCDDNRACTVNDACDGVTGEIDGGCAGEDVNLIACPVGDECPLGDCVDGLCVCSEDTPLGVVFLGKFCAGAGVDCQSDDDCPAGDSCVNGSFADPNCYSAGQVVNAAVAIGSGSEEVAGGQFLISYDNTCLQLTSVGPCAGSIFDNVISVEIDEASGSIFYAATSDPAAPVSTPGPANMVCMDFVKIGDCNSCDICLGDNNPRRTILTNISGNEVPLAREDCSKSVRDAGELSISTPGDVDANSDCDQTFASVSWNMPNADNSCEGPLSVICSAQHSDPAILQSTVDSWISGGGDIPQGTAFFICSADDSCGSTQSNLWTVRVSDQQSLDVEVQLSPDMGSGGTFSRAITFDLYDGCASDPTTVCDVLDFGGAFNFGGHAKASLKVNKGRYTCVTAKDHLHTLRACATPECIGGSWTAQWKGDPLQGGNWLIGGNLDAAKPASHGNANTINIVDFGVYMSEVLNGANYAPRGDTTCETAFPHGDVNADGAVDTLDYTFLLENFLEDSKNCCCPAPIAAGGAIQNDTSRSVKWFRANGYGDIGAAADINGDNVVDLADMAAFMQGGAPEVNRVRKSSSSR